MNVVENKKLGQAQVSSSLKNLSNISPISYSGSSDYSLGGTLSISRSDDLTRPPQVAVTYKSFNDIFNTSKVALYDSVSTYSGTLPSGNIIAVSGNNIYKDLIFSKQDLKKLGSNYLPYSIEFNGSPYTGAKSSDTPSGYFSEFVTISGAGLNSLIGVIDCSGNNINLYTYASSLKTVNIPVTPASGHRICVYGNCFSLNTGNKTLTLI
jgi:hypothetical protein